MNIGIIYALISMFAFGICTGILRTPIRQIGGVKTIFFKNAIISLILLIVTLIFIKSHVFSPLYIIIAFVIALIGYLPVHFFYKALKVGKIGIVSPVSGSAIIITIILSLIFFNETLSRNQIISIACVIIGIILLSINFKDFKQSHLLKISSGVPYALIACILWGLVFFAMKIPTKIIGPILTAWIIEIGVFTSSAIALFSTKQTSKNSKLNIPRKQFNYILAGAILGSIGTLFYMLGIMTENVSLVASISFANPLIVTIYGRMVYKEHLKRIQWFAVLLIILGIVTLSL